MKVYSGKCCVCDTGIEIGHNDFSGRPLHTGDIVMVWGGRYIGTDIEEWYPTTRLTVVLIEQYQSFSDGTIENGGREPFVMGIKSAGFNHPEWQIHLVKKHSDVVPGERWPEYGFSYKGGES